jgi:hypothetical protein
VCMHYIHTTPAQTPKLSGPQFQTFFWGFPLYKPICFRWNLENINIYIYYSNIPQIFQYHTNFRCFYHPMFLGVCPYGCASGPERPVGLHLSRMGQRLGSHEIAWVLMRLLGFSYFYLVCCEHIRTVKGLHIFGTALELWKPT